MSEQLHRDDMMSLNLTDSNILHLLASDSMKDSLPHLAIIPADLSVVEVNSIAYRIGDWAERVAPSLSGIKRSSSAQFGTIGRLAERALLEDEYRSDTTYNSCLQALQERGVKGRALSFFYKYCQKKYQQEFSHVCAAEEPTVG